MGVTLWPTLTFVISAQVFPNAFYHYGLSLVYTIVFINFVAISSIVAPASIKQGIKGLATAGTYIVLGFGLVPGV